MSIERIRVQTKRGKFNYEIKNGRLESLGRPVVCSACVENTPDYDRPKAGQWNYRPEFHFQVGEGAIICPTCGAHREIIERAKPQTWPLVIEKDDTKITVTKPRRYDDDGDSESLITVELEGQKFEYSARNIFDFGLVINPKGGGLAINVEEYIAYNKSTFADPQVAEEYRRTHPTETGWGWNRSRWIPEYQFNWEPMSELEVRAYKLAEENVPNALRGMRM